MQLAGLRVWLGLDDLDLEDDFRWADGTSMTSQQRSDFFKGSQPDDLHGDEDCVTLQDMVEGFNDYVCSYSAGAGYACEIPI